MIEIFSTRTIRFGYQGYFFAMSIFKFYIALNVFDCLFRLKKPGVMMVNIGTRVATASVVFSTSRNAALIERKLLQYTTLCLKFYHCTLR